MLEGRTVWTGNPGRQCEAWVVDTAMQEQIRNLDEERFPMLENFRSLKRNNELLDPNTVSRFLAWRFLMQNRKSLRRRTRYP